MKQAQKLTPFNVDYNMSRWLHGNNVSSFMKEQTVKNIYVNLAKFDHKSLLHHLQFERSQVTI